MTTSIAQQSAVWADQRRHVGQSHAEMPHQLRRIGVLGLAQRTGQAVAREEVLQAQRGRRSLRSHQHRALVDQRRTPEDEAAHHCFASLGRAHDQRAEVCRIEWHHPAAFRARAAFHQRRPAAKLAEFSDDLASAVQRFALNSARRVMAQDFDAAGQDQKGRRLAVAWDEQNLSRAAMPWRITGEARGFLQLQRPENREHLRTAFIDQAQSGSPVPLV